MNNEISQISSTLRDVFSGKPWYGKSISTVLNEMDPGIVYRKPGPHSHSIIELLYHMISWSDFTKQRLERDQGLTSAGTDDFNWGNTNSETHTWNNGISELTASNNKILNLLEGASDNLLNEIVDFRDYNFRFLLNGLIQHNIYHLGQMVYIQHFLSR